eukprot:5197624-Amphidinium_carterae.1
MTVCSSPLVDSCLTLMMSVRSRVPSTHSVATYLMFVGLGCGRNSRACRIVWERTVLLLRVRKQTDRASSIVRLSRALLIGFPPAVACC